MAHVIISVMLHLATTQSVNMTHDPKAGEKLRRSLDSIAIEYSRTTTGKAASLVEAFLPDSDAADIVQNLVGDVIFRYLFASALRIRDQSSADTFDDSLTQFIARKTRLTGSLAKSLRQSLKQAVLTSEEQRPKSERRGHLRVKQRNKNCYLCGGPIGDDAVLDHVWPRSAGGGNGKANLRLAHESCEAVKGDFAVCGDVSLARFAFVKPPRSISNPQKREWWPSRLDDDEDFRSFTDDLRGSQMKVAILGRQEYRCFRCEKPFCDSTACVVKKRDLEEPWWFANAIAVCDECEGHFVE